MSAHVDIFSTRESLRMPFLGSAGMHACLFGLGLLYSWLGASKPIRFGDPNAVPGGAVPINIVKAIPLSPAQTKIENPVANESRSSVPTPPPEKARAQTKVEPAPDAVPIPAPKGKREVERPAPERKFRPYVPDRDNQLYAMQGMGVNTPSYTGLRAEGFGVGIGAGSPFGARYGWYVEALQRRIGEQWQKELAQVDSRVRTARLVVVVLEIRREGSLHGIRVAESSGNPAVDYSALRAVTNANPVPPLPADLGKSSVSTEIWFQLRR